MLQGRRGLLTKTLPFLLVGVVILFLYLHFFVGIPDLVETMQRTNMYVYSFGVLLALVDIVLYSLAWQYFLRALSVKVDFKKTFGFTWVGFFADFMIPSESVSGDITKIYLMSNELEGEAGKVAASVMTQRLVFTVINLGSFIVGSAACLVLRYTMPQQVINAVLLMILLTSVSLAFLALLFTRRPWMERLLEWSLRVSELVSRGRFKKEEWKPRATVFVEVFYNATASFGERPRKLVFPVLFSVSAWIISFITCFVSFLSLGYYVPLTVIVIVYSIGIAVQYVPLGVPAEVGVTEIVMTGLLSLFGVPPEMSAAGTILTRFLTTWLRLIIGFLAVQWVGMKALMRKFP